MKKVLLPLVAISAISSTLPAYASEHIRNGVFVQAFGGATLFGTRTRSLQPDADYRTSGLYGVGAGYNLNNFSLSATLDQARLENAELTSGVRPERKLSTILANIAYNFNTGTKLIPFIGGGIGYTIGRTWYSNAADNTSYEQNNQLVWQLTAGAKYAIHRNIELFADLRFRDYAASQFSDQTLSNARRNEKYGTNFFAVTAGISYKF